MNPRASRTSRFTDATPTVQIASVREKITDEERQRRDQALERETLMDVRVLREYGIQSDNAVRNDAIGAVQIDTGEWRVRWVIADAGDSTTVVRSVYLEPTQRATPGGGVTTNLLRELSPQAALAAHATFVQLSEANDPILHLIASWEQDQAQRHGPSPESSTKPRRGRPRVSEDELARVAIAYLAHVNGPGSVTAHLEKHFGYASESTVRDRIRMCRERGWLTRTNRGRKGGRATKQLEEYISGHASMSEQDDAIGEDQ